MSGNQDSAKSGGGGDVTVAILCRKFGAAGGTENFAREIAVRVAARPGFRVHVIAEEGRNLSRGSAEVCYHETPGWRLPHIVRRDLFAVLARRASARLGADIVHAFDHVPGANIVSCGVAQEFWVREVEGRRVMPFGDRLLRRLERKTLLHPKCAEVLANSELSRRTLAEYLPEIEARVSIVEPGVDFARFEHLDRLAARDRVRHKHLLDPSDLVFLFVGNNFPLKGLQYVLPSLAVLKSRGVRAKLLVVGKGDTETFLRKAKVLGVEDCVIFAGVVPERIEEYYAASDAFILLSACETFGMAVLEAMSAGLPVIATETMGVSSLVKQGESGFLLPYPVEPAVCAEYLACLTDPDRRRRMGECGMKTARNHTWDLVCDRVVEAYRRALAKL